MMVSVKSRTFNLLTSAAYMPTRGMNDFPDIQDDKQEQVSEGICSGYQSSALSNDIYERQPLHHGGRFHQGETDVHRGKHPPRPLNNQDIHTDNEYYQPQSWHNLPNPYH